MVTRRIERPARGYRVRLMAELAELALLKPAAIDSEAFPLAHALQAAARAAMLRPEPVRTFMHAGARFRFDYDARDIIVVSDARGNALLEVAA